MTLTHIANLLCPLTNSIALQSWEDAEDIAREITRLCRLKRLQELQGIQEALSEKAGGLSASPPENKAAPSPHAALNSPIPVLPVTPETRFDETGHAEQWRNEVATELNWIMGLAESRQRPYEIDYFAAAALSIAARVAQFEEIRVKP